MRKQLDDNMFLFQVSFLLRSQNSVANMANLSGFTWIFGFQHHIQKVCSSSTHEKRRRKLNSRTLYKVVYQMFWKIHAMACIIT